MKTLLYLFVPVIAGALVFTSCNKAGNTSSTAKKDSVVMPIKASYSSSFTISDSANMRRKWYNLTKTGRTIHSVIEKAILPIRSRGISQTGVVEK